MAISINIDGNSYEINGLDHPAEEETARKLLTLMEKYAKEDKDLQTKLLKEFKDQLTKLNKEVNTLATATTKPATAPAANRPANNTAPTSAAAKALNNAAGAANNNSRVLNNLTTSAGFATGAVNSMADGLKEGTSKFTGALGIAGGALKAVGAAAGFVVTSLMGLGIASVNAFMDASKFQGDLAKGGIRFTESLTSLNSASYNAGMTMEQMTAVVKGSSQAISQLGKGGTNGAARFAQLVAAARSSTESLRGFGFTAQEEAQVRADYLDILRLQGNSETARTMSNGQIIAQSNKMAKGFMGVAAASGKTIDELIKKTKEIAGEDDFGLTVEALGLTAEQSTRLAKNLAVLDAQGLGSLKQVFLEMRTFGTSIGETGIELKTLGIGPQVENFLDKLDKLEPDQVQGELVKFAKTLPQQQLAEFVTKIQGTGTAGAKVANELRRLSKLNKEDLDAMAKTAQQKNASLEAAKRLEDDTIKLKGMITNVLLRIAESPGFQRILGQLMSALENYGPQISESLANIAVGMYEFVSKVFTPQGRQEIMNDVATAFSEILIGIKKAVLGPLGMYTEEQERAERALRVAANDRRMAETIAFSNDKEIQAKQVEYNKLRIQSYEALLKGDGKALDAVNARMATINEEIDARKTELREKSPIVQKTLDNEKKAEGASEKLGNSNIKLGLVALGFVGALWGAKKLIVAGLERLLLGKDITRGAGPFEKIAGLFGSKDKAAAGAPGVAGKPGAEMPTTAKGVGLGVMSDMGKQFTQALGWVLKAGAIAGAMYMIGKAMPVLAEGVKSFDGVDWESMAKAGTAITGMSVALFALGKVPLSAMLQGFVGAAAVSGAMVILSFGFSQLVPQLKAFQDLDWETMAKALVALVGLGAVGVAAGAVAVPLLLGSVAIGALGLALSLFPTDTLVALGKLFESVGAAIGGIVAKIGEGIGLVVDKIAALRNSGIEATTAQIERLSQIPSAQLFDAAKGVTALKEALDGFGGSFWENIGRGITGMFGGDQVSQIERAAAAMEKYKSSVSVLKESAKGEYILKPIDIGLYEQLQQTLDQTKGQINTTFAAPTYEKTFKGTRTAIDSTYNHVTSKLIDTLNATKKAIADTFAAPIDALAALAKAIKAAIQSASETDVEDAAINSNSKIAQADRAKVITARLMKEFGLTTEQAAGFTGNLTFESQLNPNAEGPQTSQGKALGIAQWLGPRRKKLEAFAKARGKSSTDFNTQLEYLVQELRTDEAASIVAVKNQKTLTGSADAVLHNFERAGKGEQYLDKRRGYAGAVYRLMGGNTSALLANSPNTRVSSPDLNITPVNTNVAFNSGLSQFTRNEKGQLVPMAKDTKGTITAVSNEDDTQDKMLNLLEQTYNLHADHYSGVKKAERFKGFTQG